MREQLNLIQAENNLELLSEICRNSRKALVFISPWISEREIIQLVDLTKLSAKIKIITRWPLPNDSPRYIDIDAIKYAFSDERIQLEWSSSENDLHAKVYYSHGSGALVTSSNLTKKGFPPADHSERANIELGLFVSEGKLLSDIGDWISNLSTTAAKVTDLDKLLEWENEYRLWAKKITPAPTLKRPNWNPQRPAVASLNSIQGKPGLAKFEHIAIGKGIAAFNLYFMNDSPAYPIRVLTSIQNERGQYHFEISKDDVALWQRTRRHRKPYIRGVVLSVVELDHDGNRVFSDKIISPVFIPFDFMFGSGNLPIKKFMLRKRAQGKSRVVFIEKSAGDWILTCPSLKNNNKQIRIPVRRCVGKTTQMREKESWRLRVT